MYTLHVREALREGVPLNDALAMHAGWARSASEDRPRATTVVSQNDRSLAQLQAMMGGLR